MSKQDQCALLLCVARTTTLAEHVFGDEVRALQWLHTPKRRLGGKAPVQLLATIHGCKRVSAALVTIDEGYAA
jgi:putative toxin-antitoxin system antitoxin component (TIGR02293 family)